jgi:hypothetical protein
MKTEAKTFFLANPTGPSQDRIVRHKRIAGLAILTFLSLQYS